MRSGKPLSLIMADIDYFKRYNDNYGHIKGDESIIKVAKAMASSVKRPTRFSNKIWWRRVCYSFSRNR